MDSNHDKELQRLLCYHYTTGQERQQGYLRSAALASAATLDASSRHDPLTKTMKRVDISFAKAKEPTSDGMQQMYRWANNVFADSFG